MTEAFFAVVPGPFMGDVVTCKECGTRYDSGHGFCPHCGSTVRGSTLPAAVAVAQRRDPGRRRVQASGALLLLVGALFLLSSLIGLAVPMGEVAQQFVEPMADQPGGTLVLQGPQNASFAAVVTTQDGAELANVTGHVGALYVTSPDHASLHVVASWQANGTAGSMGFATEFDAIVLPGNTLEVGVDEVEEGTVVVSATLRKIVQVGRVAFIAVAATLLGGGLCALLLRAWPFAVAAALLGILLAAIVLVGYLVAGLLFALPFGFAAFFILRGRRYFRRAGG
jgi:hypothetical protein